MPRTLPTQGNGSRRYWFCAVAALMLMGTQAQAQINPFRSGRNEPRLSSQDFDLLMSSANEANRAPAVAVGTTAAWKNPQTGSHGTSKVERIFQQKGMTCHLLRQDVFVRGAPQARRYDLTWCLTPSGEWKIAQ